MEKKARCLEVRAANGNLLFSLYLLDKVISLEDKPADISAQKSEAKEEKGQAGNPQAGESFMTGAQKRYLFRILAERGMEGDQAYQRLKDLFQVESLKEVGKLEASKMIDRLLGEAKGGAEDGIPF